MSMKILSPAGDMESLKMAIYNGADEVYLGVKDFNARNIEGFSLTTLKEAVDFAHVYGVKVNLTVNILFKDDELQTALDLVVDAYNLGVDCFIVQDFGLASLIHENYPQIELHASTQMGIHNLEGVKAIEKFGFKRVVLARETPLEEIERINKNSSIEIEYFCQGALCVSFSGNCYLSSYLHNASGNRGKCKQLCRLPYSFRYNNKEIKNGYLLSAKDFYMLENLSDLKNAGVDVLKIEGRARRPYYVGTATKIYRQALNEEKYNLEELQLAFNRGYTAGYFNGNGKIISNKQNHIGIEIGKVEKFKVGKRFNEIFVSSNRVITPKSVLKILNNNEEVVLTAYDVKKLNNEYVITTTQKVNVGDKVNIISDFEQEQKLLICKNKKEVNIKITALENSPITAEFVLNNEKVIFEGDLCSVAKNQPITKDELISNFTKSEMFLASLNITLGNVFLPKQKINEFRRGVFECIFNKLTEIKKAKLNKILINSLKINENIKKINNFQEIFNKNEKLLEKNIIYSPEEYTLQDVEEFITICKKQNKKPFLNLPIFALRQDIDMLKNIVEVTKIAVVVNNAYALNFETEKVIGGGMNVCNSCSANYFNLPFIQAEGTNFKMPYMTLRHCPMKSHLNANCNNCPYKAGYEYVMQNGKRFKLKRIKMKSCTFELR